MKSRAYDARTYSALSPADRARFRRLAALLPTQGEWDMDLEAQFLAKWNAIAPDCDDPPLLERTNDWTLKLANPRVLDEPRGEKR